MTENKAEEQIVLPRLIAPHSLEARRNLYIQLPFGHYLETEYHTYIPGSAERPVEAQYTPVYAGPCPIWERGTCEFQGYMHGIYGSDLLLKCFVCDTVRVAYAPVTMEEWQMTVGQVLAEAQAVYDRQVSAALAAKKDGSKEIPI
jgi:hypothetical protein